MANKKHLARLQQGVAAWNQWRAANLDVRPDFSRANLRRATLSQANLYRANLTQGDLAQADLTQANLMQTTLYQTTLREANLVQANLREANLTDANFTRAKLHQANLTGALLLETNLEGGNGRDGAMRRNEDRNLLKIWSFESATQELFSYGVGHTSEIHTVKKQYVRNAEFACCVLSHVPSRWPNRGVPIDRRALWCAMQTYG